MFSRSRRIAHTVNRLVLGIAMSVLAIAAMAMAGCSNLLVPHPAWVDGRAVEVVTAGTGTSTVVFESGLGADWTPWDETASEVAGHARVFAYSRPGYGGSEPTTTPRDAHHIVEELRRLLADQGYAPPYVLVGHSFGGAYMELYAKTHPDEVAGVVLVDPRHRDFQSACERNGLEVCAIPSSLVAWLPDVQKAEIAAFRKVSEEIGAAPFGSYPVRVLTSTAHGHSDTWESLWRSMLASLASEAGDGRAVVFEGAGHNLHVERPHDVAEAIVAIVDARR